MTDSHIKPTDEQWEQSGLVQVEILEVIERLMREGIDWRIVLTGATSALANVVMAKAGPAEVCPFFARTAAQTLHLSGSNNG